MMTNVNIFGDVTIVDRAIVTLAGGSQASPTVISPSGKSRTVVYVPSTPGQDNPGSNTFFKMDASFNVGDVVEICTVPGLSAATVSDENNVLLSGTLFRKLLTGAPTHTYANGNTLGIPTWGAL